MIIILNNNQQPVAVLDDYFSDEISEQVNGGYTLSFSTTLDQDKSIYIAAGNFVEVDGQLFNITEHRRTRGADGKVVVSVFCEQVSYDLIRTIFEGGFVQAGTPSDLIAMVLDGTGFSAGIVEKTDTISVELREGVTAREIILEIARLTGGELRFSQFTVDLLNRRGIDRGVMFALGKNLRGIIKHVDARPNPPQTAYEINVLELRELPEFAGLEEFELGDTVLIRDDELEIDEYQRIIEYSYSPKRRINSKVKIAAYIPGIQDQVYRIQTTTVSKDKYLYGTRIGPEIGFESVRYDKKSRMVANADEFKIQKGNGSGSYTNAIYMDANGDARFTGIVEASQFIGGTITIGSGNNVFRADAAGIWAGHVNFANAPFRVNMAGQMEAVGAKFSGEISGTTITGGTITGALIQTDPDGVFPRTVLSNSGKMLAAYGSATKFVGVTPSQSGEPAIVFNDVTTRAVIQHTGSSFFVGTTSDPMSLYSAGKLQINSPGDIDISSAGGNLNLSGISLKIDTHTGYTGSFMAGTQSVIVHKGIIIFVSPPGP